MTMPNPNRTPEGQLRPALGDPDYKPAATDDESTACAGWDIGTNSRISYGRDPSECLSVGVSACSTGVAGSRTIMVRRAVTPIQLVAHAQHLLLVARDEITADPRLIMAPALCDIDTAITFCTATGRHIAMANEENR